LTEKNKKSIMKEKKIFKNEKIIAEHSGFGWIFHYNEKKYIKSYIRRHKDKIHKYESLLSCIRGCYLDDILTIFKRFFRGR